VGYATDRWGPCASLFIFSSLSSVPPFSFHGRIQQAGAPPAPFLFPTDASRQLGGARTRARPCGSAELTRETAEVGAGLSHVTSRSSPGRRRGGLGMVFARRPTARLRQVRSSSSLSPTTPQLRQVASSSATASPAPLLSRLFPTLASLVPWGMTLSAKFEGTSSPLDSLVYSHLG
jgi:hypothetical protein